MLSDTKNPTHNNDATVALWRQELIKKLQYSNKTKKTLADINFNGVQWGSRETNRFLHFSHHGQGARPII
jgi:hypothetical protein